ncbi:hypothetical protein FPZ47_05715 [Mycobacterium helveticum]|uniref:Uncharacterized protein n=1 Tax=Mycobacterium helveticum TaxID=2592811 RepID=A0A557XYP1_9MYCO|nr:hypothetical protein FPZ46_10595 [Mycobacterium helveticum]TVS91295.1 hypothetical protein FPZ47_05715 [Mycobacterium helveticum]
MLCNTIDTSQWIRGAWVATTTSAPSSSGPIDVLVAVKKAGLPWPAPSKKEQRSQRRKEGPSE